VTVRIIPPYRELNRQLPRRLRWTRARVPTRQRIPKLHRPEGHEIVRPSARVSLMQLVTTLGVVAVMWVVGAIFQTVYAGRIYPHVTIDHVPVGGLTRADALAALRDTETARVNAPIFVQAGDKSWQVTPARFGARYDSAAAVDRALALAHSGPLFFGGWTEAQTIFSGANVPLSGTHDVAAVSRFVTSAKRDVYVPPRRAVVGVDGNDVAILHGSVPGRQLDVAGAAAALGAVINTHDATSVALPLQQVESDLGDDKAQAVLDQARALLSARVQFLYNNVNSGTAPPWYLDRAGLLRLLTFTPTCGTRSCRFDLGIDVRKLAVAFDRGGVARNVDRAPTPAYYSLYKNDNDPNHTQVRPNYDYIGQTINVDRAAALILQQADVPASSRTVYIPTLTVSASFTLAAAQALNFNANVGSVALGYTGLDWARQGNLDTAANAITNTIVQPGHTFSFAAIAGPLDATQGYTAGQNMVGPNDITGVNGGANLVASAALAAAYDAGLSIDRRVHYPYLNLYTQPGLDAMVGYDARVNANGHAGQGRVPDLVFRNTTNHPVLVMADSATPGDGTGVATVYIFNSAGYAPMRQQGSYSVDVGTPQVTLNPDGSVDTTIARAVTINGKVTTTTRDSLSSHYAPIDP